MNATYDDWNDEVIIWHNQWNVIIDNTENVKYHIDGNYIDSLKYECWLKTSDNEIISMYSAKK